ncbi:MAG: TonB family protein [Cyclobacteriaceae bacterium]
MSIYLIELGVIHTLLILGYWFFLSKERQYAKMRFYLVAATLASLIIPLLKLPALFFNGDDAVRVIPALPAYTFEVTQTGSMETSFWTWNLILWVYLAISGFFLLGFLKNLFSLALLERKSRYEKFRGMFIRRVSGVRGSFTFFNRIFLSEEINEDQEDYETILKHEHAHVALGHTYDIIFFELFRICFWWLPTSWFVRKEIKKIHEYQADALALKTCDPEKYSTILISSTLQLHGLSLASSFHDGLILQRLKAMKEQAKKLSPWKIGALTALSALLFIVFACNEELDNEIKKMGENSNAITFDQLPVVMQKSLADKKDDLTYVKLDLPEDGNSSKIQELAGIDPSTIQSMSVYKRPPDEGIYIAIRKEGANFDYLSERSRIAEDSDPNNPLFVIVEDQPEYPGGIDAFYRYIANNMIYPTEARTNGIEGRVYVQFVVDKDGSITDVEPVKGIGGGCDEEAVRVIQNAEKFNPGKQRGMPVRVRMVMPIIFKLDQAKLNPDNTSQGAIIIDKVKINGDKLKVNAKYVDGIWQGKVYSPEGDPLAGASIIVDGSSNGTVSDIDGNFTIKTSEDNALRFSFVGYESVLVKGK